MKNLIIILLLTPFLFSNCSKKTNGTTALKKGVKFVEYETLSEAIAQAEQEGKLVFIDFYADWCAPCKMMDKDVFTDREIATFFNANFVNFKVDGEKGYGPNIAALYDLKAYPTLVWIDTKGRVLERTEGGTYHTELMKLAQRALSHTGQ